MPAAPPNILLTGAPGCGKTTLIQRILSRLDLPVGGFYTQEIRLAGRRLGFEIVTLDDRRAVLAHVDIRSSRKVGKYGLDLVALESLAVDAVLDALRAGELVVIDEIGPMEIASPRFRETAVQALDSPAPVLATIVRRSTPFTDTLKRRPDITLIEVRRENRENLPERILELLAT